jgi:ribonuclease HI
VDRVRVLRASSLLAFVSPAKKLSAFVDGAARGNPGPASAGVVFQDESGEVVKTLAIPLGQQTNNTAEWCALILALQQALMMGTRKLEVFADSELIVRQFGGQYKVKEPSLRALHALALHLKAGFESLSVSHVPREKNKLADAEANRALDNPTLFA